jgi:hypothetical protein
MEKTYRGLLHVADHDSEHECGCDEENEQDRVVDALQKHLDVVGVVARLSNEMRSLYGFYSKANFQLSVIDSWKVDICGGEGDFEIMFEFFETKILFFCFFFNYSLR